MRLSLAADLETRDGTPAKDSRLTNCYAEIKGDASVVRKRPAMTLNATIGSGVAQGGIAVGASQVFTVNSDIGLLT